MKQYIDYFLGAFFGLLILAIWYFSSLAVETKIVPIEFDYFIKLLSTAIGAFAGAFYAFRFNRQLNEEKVTAEHLGNIRNTLFKLMLKKYNVVDKHTQYLIKYEDQNLNWLTMPATDEILNAEGNIDLDSLGFLQHKYGVELFDLYNAQITYQQALNVLNERSVLHREQLQPLLKQYLPVAESDEHLAILLSERHPEVTEHLKACTSHIFKMFDLASERLSSSITRFESIASDEFPGEVFLKEEVLLKNT